jgi:hypothetical protein
VRFINKLKTNDNILIAIGSITHARSPFLDVFLMTFMMRLSLENSPTDYIVYKILSFFLMGVLACCLVRIIHKHPLASYRLGMVAACLQIVVIATLHQYPDIYPFVLALFTGVKATLFWRPHTYFCCTEVPNSRRLRFESLGLIWGSILKISLPVVLGLIIVETNFVNSAIIVLIISFVQLFISLLFRPTCVVKTSTRPLLKVWKKYVGKGVFKRLAILQLRGLVGTGSAYSIVPIFLIYNILGSDFELGLWTSIGAVVAIGLTMFFGIVKKRRLALIVFALLMVASPLLLMMRLDLALIIGFYIVSVAVAGKLLDLVASVSASNILYDVDDADKIEMDVFNEITLNFYRVLGLGGLLVAVSLPSASQYLILIVAIASALLAMPLVITATYRRKN